MHMRPLGRSGLTVPPLCFGGNVFGWTIDEAMSHRLLDALLDAGLTFIDTADVYSSWAPGNRGGESETIIGSWLKARGCRDRIVLATKVGSEMGPGQKGLKAPYIAEAVEASLRRLQTDVIDLYQSHWDDPSTLRGDARRLPAAHRAGQGARHRRLQSQRGPAARGTGHQRPHRPAPLRDAAARV